MDVNCFLGEEEGVVTIKEKERSESKTICSILQQKKCLPTKESLAVTFSNIALSPFDKSVLDCGQYQRCPTILH